MDDSLLVRRVQGLGQLAAEADDLDGRDAAAQPADPPAQGLTLEVLHHDVCSTVWEPTALRDLNHSGVIDPVRGARFIEEALDHGAVARVIRVEDLDGDAPLNGVVDGLEDGPHTALPDATDEAVWTYVIDDHRYDKPPSPTYQA